MTPATVDIRDFLTRYFSDEELTTLCFDHFPEVHNNFSSGMSKGQKIQLLIDHCTRREVMPDLLKVLAEARPKQFRDRSGASGANFDQNRTSLQRQLNEARANLQLIEERKAEFVMGTDVPLQLIKEERRLLDRIAALEAQLGSSAPPSSTPSRSTSSINIENPFYTNGRINDPAMFFDREQLVREIREELKKRSSVALSGDSQMGKSSLLNYLYATRAEWLPGVPIEYIDLQRVLDEADFCETVLQRLGLTGNSLRELKHALETHAVILLLDEIERIAEPDFSTRLHDLLRSLAQDSHFAMCVATQHPLEEVFPSRSTNGVSPFHNIFTRKMLGPFTESDAQRFLTTQLARTSVTFTEHEIERLLRDSQCQPARLQLLAKNLFDEKTHA
jgi:hypothetical protein